MFGSPNAQEPLRATVRIQSDDAYKQMVLGGSVGTAEALMDGGWECDDLVSLVRIFVRNRDVLITPGHCTERAAVIRASPLREG